MYFKKRPPTPNRAGRLQRGGWFNHTCPRESKGHKTWKKLQKSQRQHLQPKRKHDNGAAEIGQTSNNIKTRCGQNWTGSPFKQKRTRKEEAKNTEEAILSSATVLAGINKQRRNGTISTIITNRTIYGSWYHATSGGKRRETWKNENVTQWSRRTSNNRKSEDNAQEEENEEKNEQVPIKGDFNGEKSEETSDKLNKNTQKAQLVTKIDQESSAGESLPCVYVIPVPKSTEILLTYEQTGVYYLDLLICISAKPNGANSWSF